MTLDPLFEDPTGSTLLYLIINPNCGVLGRSAKNNINEAWFELCCHVMSLCFDFPVAVKDKFDNVTMTQNKKCYHTFFIVILSFE